MTSFREHLDAVEAADDLLTVTEEVHWSVEASTAAREAVEHNGPALLFAETPGEMRLVSGLYTGPDLIERRVGKPWSRIALGVGRAGLENVSYADLLQTVAASQTARGDAERREIEATPCETDLYAFGFPKRTVDGRPTVTLGLLAMTLEDTTVWVPVRGTVRGADQLRVSVPWKAAVELEGNTPVTLALGVPAAALLVTSLQWAGETGIDDSVARANAIDSVPVGESAGGLVPSTAEVLIDGVASRCEHRPEGPQEAWEQVTSVDALDVYVTRTATRENPTVPFVPLRASMADDITLMGLVEAARLHHRVNNYWGVSPVEWISLPAETCLGICLVASEILYAGFEWQLANTLFSFSRLFDKVLILDTDTPPADLARAFDDMWVKAHPSHDWAFSEPDAPAAKAPMYRRDATTGSRLYINATWDPRWDEEYIAPRVGFTTSYPEEIRDTVVERWTDFGFDNPPYGH